MSTHVADRRLERVDACCWRLPRTHKPGMRVDGLIFSDEEMLEKVIEDQALDQVANVAFLPGIQRASLAMPDIHWGYGFCIGGVCATDPHEGGVISPGGVGYDINCGVRLVRTSMHESDVRPRLKQLVTQLMRDIPTGVGRRGKYHFGRSELFRVLHEGCGALLERGLATRADLDRCEAGGCIENASPGYVSDRAIERGADQCGTVGSGNHFLEVQVVDRVVDEHKARVMGLREGQVVVLIHSGSRGLGYQVCDDTLREYRTVPGKYGISLPDRQLACAPIESKEGRKYLGAMRSAANFAFCNRQLLMWQTREVFEGFFGRSWDDLGMSLVYDVAHNMAKFETHRVGGRSKLVCVHRKGATRAFPPGHPDVCERYREIGQPVIIPGDMGRASWVLAGAPAAMEKTFGTTCHGAGRAMSRKASIRHAQGRRVDRELEQRGIIARARSWKGLAEEQPMAYKDVDRVVDVVHRAGLSTKVARLRPMGVIKG